MQPLKRFSVSYFLTSVLITVICSLPVQAADLLSGTWKQNMTKSTWSPASNTPKEPGVSIIKVNQDEVSMMNNGVNAQGQKTHLEYKAKFDGKDYPVTYTVDGKPSPNFGDSVTWKKIDDHTYENVGKLKGQVLNTTRMTISMDGKTRTNRVTGKNGMGQTVNNTVVSER